MIVIMPMSERMARYMEEVADLRLQLMRLLDVTNAQLTAWIQANPLSNAREALSALKEGAMMDQDAARELLLERTEGEKVEVQR